MVDAGEHEGRATRDNSVQGEFHAVDGGAVDGEHSGIFVVGDLADAQGAVNAYCR